MSAGLSGTGSLIQPGEKSMLMEIARFAGYTAGVMGVMLLLALTVYIAVAALRMFPRITFSLVVLVAAFFVRKLVANHNVNAFDAIVVVGVFAGGIVVVLFLSSSLTVCGQRIVKIASLLDSAVAHSDDPANPVSCRECGEDIDKESNACRSCGWSYEM